MPAQSGRKVAAKGRQGVCHQNGRTKATSTAPKRDQACQQARWHPGRKQACSQDSRQDTSQQNGRRQQAKATKGAAKTP